jgi:hypothetical protein
MAKLLFAQNVIKKTGGYWWCLVGLQTDAERSAVSTFQAVVVGVDTSSAEYTILTGELLQYIDSTRENQDGHSYALRFNFTINEQAPSGLRSPKVRLTYTVDNGSYTTVGTLEIPVTLYDTTPPSGAVGVPVSDPDSERYILFDTASTLSVPLGNFGLTGTWSVVSATNNVVASITSGNLVIDHSRLTLVSGQPCGFFDVTLQSGSTTKVLKFTLVTDYAYILDFNPKSINYTSLSATITINKGPKFGNVPSTKSYKIVANFDTQHAISNNMLDAPLGATFPATMTPTWPLDYYHYPSRLILKVTGVGFDISGDAGSVNVAVTSPDHGKTPVASTDTVLVGKNFYRPRANALAIDLSSAFSYDAPDPVLYEVAAVETSNATLADALKDISTKSGIWWEQNGSELRVYLPAVDGITQSADLTLVVYGKNIFGRRSSPIRIRGFYFPAKIDYYTIQTVDESGASVTFTCYDSFSPSIPNEHGEFTFDVSGTSPQWIVRIGKKQPTIYGEYNVAIPMSGLIFNLPINFPLNKPTIDTTNLPSNLVIQETTSARLDMATYSSPSSFLQCTIGTVTGPVVANVSNNTVVELKASPTAGVVNQAAATVVIHIKRATYNTKGQYIESESASVTLAATVTNLAPRFKFPSIDFGTVAVGTSVQKSLDEYLDYSSEQDVITNVYCDLPFVRAYYAAGWRLVIAPTSSNLGTQTGTLTVVDSAGARASVPVRVNVVPQGSIIFSLPERVDAKFGTPLTVYLGNYLIGITEEYVKRFELEQGKGEVKKI